MLYEGSQCDRFVFPVKMLAVNYGFFIERSKAKNIVLCSQWFPKKTSKMCLKNPFYLMDTGAAFSSFSIFGSLSSLLTADIS